MRQEAMEQWREAAAKLPGERQGRRYPEHLREAAVELASAAVASGMPLVEVSRRMGVPEGTLKAWRRQRALVPVTVVEDTPAAVRLHVGCGHADLSVDQLVALLRKMS